MKFVIIFKSSVLPRIVKFKKAAITKIIILSKCFFWDYGKSGPLRGGRRDNLSQGLRVFGASELKDLDILTAGSPLKCIFSQSKGVTEKIFSLRSKEASPRSFVPWASKSSRRPCGKLHKVPFVPFSQKNGGNNISHI